MVHFVIVILLLVTPQQNDVVIEADRQEKEQNISRATGNVVVTYQDMRIEADEVTYDETTKVVTAGEHIRFTRGDEHLEADSIRINLDTKEGTLTNVSGELGPGFFITASEADRKRGWPLRAEERDGNDMRCARARLDARRSPAPSSNPNRHVTARNSIFRLEGVPLFYMPYVMVPTANRSRSTGFLIPSTSTSTTKGRSIRETFYYAINRSSDATFTGEYFTGAGSSGNRGLQCGARADSRIN